MVPFLRPEIKRLRRRRAAYRVGYSRFSSFASLLLFSNVARVSQRNDYSTKLK